MRCSLIILLFFLFSEVWAQDTGNVYSKRVVLETEFEVLLGYYGQDGNHSAVTGGEGTEKLTVIPMSLSVTENIDTTNRLLINGGVDLITSASTDNIDFAVSSASYKDRRLWLTLGYARKFHKSGLDAGVGFGASVESDYLSYQPALWLDWTSRNLMSAISVRMQGYIDDLRWGRFNEQYKRPVSLVYPVELRGTEWFDEYMRYTVNTDVSFRQDLTKRLNFGLFTGFYAQTGLLSTPFHRVYFADTSAVSVEKLPGERYKLPVGILLNAFATSRWVIRFYYRYYWDNFGIRAHTLSVETPVVLSKHFRLNPFFRFYTQTQSYYFNPYGEHFWESKYYTSDYDLSAFNSYKIGVGLRFIPFKRLGKSTTVFKEIAARYAFYYRSDGLSAHIVTLYIGLGVQRIQKPKKQAGKRSTTDS